MKPILLVVIIDAHFTELVRVARMLKEHPDFEPIVFFAERYPNLAKDVATCQREGIRCLDGEGEPLEPAVTTRDTRPLPPPRPSTINRLLGKLPPELLVSAFAVPIWIAGYRSSVRKAGRILDRHRPWLLVLAEDNPGYLTSAYVAAGHDRGIASVIVPYTVATRREAAEAYYEIGSHGVRGANRIVAAVFPRWVHEHRDRRLLRLPAGKLLALEALRLAPPDPWTYLSGSADVIAVESDRMERHYLREGLPPERLVRTGALYDDVLARNRSAALENRRAVLKDAGLTDDKPLVLCALPPDQFTCIRPGREFASQRELLEFMVETFRSVAANVVYRLHPRTRAEEMEFLRALGAPIIDRDTAELVPLCDVFVASVSATIRWAIACGKPVINYDMHRYRYHDFDEAGGVVTIEDKADFPRVVRDVVANRATYAARQAAVAPDWATLDGKAGARMAQLFDRVAKEPR
jgi:hypothetical protein